MSNSRPIPAKPAPARPIPRLYLVTPPIAEVAPFSASLGALLGVADVAAVLLRLADADERTWIKRVKELAPIIQGKGTALVLEGHVEVVARAGADGAHLSGMDAFQAAVPTLKPSRIAGVGGLDTRHDAMLAAELGADYVMFGEPAEDGRCPPASAVLDRIQWWAEVFEPPCIGYAGSLGEIAPLVEAGADFVAVGNCIWNDEAGPAAALRAAAAQLRLPEPAA